MSACICACLSERRTTEDEWFGGDRLLIPGSLPLPTTDHSVLLPCINWDDTETRMLLFASHHIRFCPGGISSHCGHMDMLWFTAVKWCNVILIQMFSSPVSQRGFFPISVMICVSVLFDSALVLSHVDSHLKQRQWMEQSWLTCSQQRC